MIDEDELTPLELGWRTAMSTASRSECPSAESLLEVAEQGKRSRQFTACMNHLAVCPKCTQLMFELREATELSKRSSKRTTKLVVVVGGGLAVAASIVFAVFFAGRAPGGIGPVDSPQHALANMVALVRSSEALDIPAGLIAFDSTLGINRGEGEIPELVSPVATWVVATNVQFEWKPVEDAQSYVVLLQPVGGQLRRITAATSVQIDSGTLDRGVTYLWQVVARVGGDERASPEAEFRVLSTEESSELADLLRTKADPIALAAIYGHYGLLDLADRELKRAEQGADASIAGKLRVNLDSRRFKGESQ